MTLIFSEIRCRAVSTAIRVIESRYLQCCGERIIDIRTFNELYIPVSLLPLVLGGSSTVSTFYVSTFYVASTVGLGCLGERTEHNRIKY